MKYFYVVVLVISFGMDLKAQTEWVSEFGADINTVDVAVMPPVNRDKLLAKTRSVLEDNGPIQFAKPISYRLNKDVNGTWESLPDGKMLWRQRIYSSGAYSLNVGFDRFHLPDGARMYLYDRAKTYVIGPIGPGDNEEHRQWWSPIVPGDELIIEVQLKSNTADDLDLEVSQVNHDFVGFGNLVSGSCNVDVACGSEDGADLALIDRFRDIINSVGMYTLNGFEQCSGALANTTRNDCTPYFLTANHCEITAANAASVVVYWNYQNPTCRLPGSAASGAPGDGSRLEFNSGASLVANYDQSDMTLLLLDDDVEASTNPFFAGWDVEGEVFDSTLCIHHPSTEEKRISFDFDPSVPFTDGFFMRVTDWDIGTTEGGSSGSPLFSMDKRVVGLLTGGDAACGNDLQDDYGMMKLSWEGGRTPETSLRPWLDPDNTGLSRIDGRFCVDVAKVDRNVLAYCTRESRLDSVVLNITSGYANGATVEVSTTAIGILPRARSNRLQAGVPLTIDIEVTDEFEDVEADVVISIIDEFGTQEINVDVIANEDVPPSPTLRLPQDGAGNINFDVDFEWTSRGISHLLEVSTDQNFTQIVRSVRVENTNRTSLKSFDSRTLYFWRVKSTNQCGESSFSEISRFSTGLIECMTFASTDAPIQIGLEAATFTSHVDIMEVGLVADVGISQLVGQHTWISDLTFILRSPSGTEARLAVSPCDDEDDFRINFDDEADNVLLPCPLISNQSFKPLDALSVFDGELAEGRWTLIVEDNARLDGGSLDGWSLDLCVNQSANRTAAFSPSVIEVCESSRPDSIVIEGFLAGEFVGDVSLDITDIEGNQIAAQFSENPLTNSGSYMFVVTLMEPEQLVAGLPLLFIFEDDMEVDTLQIPVETTDLPGPPQIAQPPSDAVGVELRTFFEWDRMLGITDYRLVLAEDEDLASVLLDTTITSSSLTLPFKLDTDQQYFWQVTSIGSCGASPAVTNTFRTDFTDATIDLTLREVEVFPNPFDNTLRIVRPISLAGESVRLEIIDPLGHLVTQVELDSEVTSLRTSTFPAGVHFARLVSPRGIYVFSLIKS
ncbi:MAG: proprotein convertase P-domain-containing protein [Bacteroidota bacterium]